MTVSGWLRSRVPVPPPELAARLKSALGTRGGSDAADAANVCVDAAEELLRDLLGRPSTGRESALDLLTVDALVTYGLEAASTAPASLEMLATTSMRRFAFAAQA